MAEIVDLVNVTPGKLTFTFRGDTYVMGGEASYVSQPGEPDYSAYTSSVENVNARGESVRFSDSDIKEIIDQLRPQMATRNMTIEFLP